MSREAWEAIKPAAAVNTVGTTITWEVEEAVDTFVTSPPIILGATSSAT